MNRTEPRLSVTGLRVFYDSIKAVDDVSFEVEPGEIVTLIGANGAGKSSILRAISGLIPYTGRITYGSKDLKKMEADRIVAAGIAHVPEGRGIFGNLTVMENLKLACWQRKDKAKIAGDLEQVFELFPRLRERGKQLGGMLSGGEQQMLAVGRALMTDTPMLLLDEPSMGLSPVLVRDIFKIIQEINLAGKTILLVEQNANMSLHIASRGYVLETGRIVLSGTGKELTGNPRVKEAYLGG
ncbi:MAG: ABC transporter ATP-binding protein [Proteobacteria bacterium]|nr:ABC transporter ATP-binding protein [Pseudomonadota bacterium]MBU4470004.1 ABC transporter ATP-binding protein [Pseudomonadota bacterium]MCG2753785.1 ABC transporter ATP-binding protein [Desulfobacteraceae bacterium]